MRKLRKSLALILAVAMVLTTFGFTTAFAANFSDTSGHWAESVIDKWSNSGVINGYEDGTFAPDAYLTRAELAKIISAEKGYETLAEISFTDVQGDEWFAADLRKCVAQGVIGGYDDGTFRPDSGVTREEAATMFQRAYAINTIGLLSFTDTDSISDWAKTSVTALVGSGVISGYEDGTFRPADLITRAEVVKILDGITTAVEQPQSTSSNVGTGSVGGIGNLGGGNGGGGGGSSSGGSTSNSYKVTFNANGGSFTNGVKSTSISVTRNAVVGSKVGEPTREGYIFDGWYTSLNSAEALNSAYKWSLNSSTVTSNITLYAGWYVNGSSVVTFETNNGTPAVERQDVENGSYATEPDVELTRAGYTFTGWYKSNTSFSEGNKFDFAATPIKENTIIYAGWQVNAEYADKEVSIPTVPTGQLLTGSIDPVPPKAIPGETVTINIIPPSTSDAAYKVEEAPTIKYVSLTGETKEITGVTVNEDALYSFSFKMPDDVQDGTIEIMPKYIQILPPTPEPTATSSLPTATPAREPLYYFSSVDFADLNSLPQGKETNGLTLGSYKEDIAIDGSNKTFSVLEDYPGNSGYKYTRRLKIGTVPLSFDVTGPCYITIDAVSASSADRTYSVLAGSEELTKFTCLEDAANSCNIIYTGGAGTITIKPDAGINVYGIFVDYFTEGMVTPSPLPTAAPPTPEPTLDPNLTYAITVDESIPNGSVVVNNGTISSDQISSVEWDAISLMPENITEDAYDSGGATTIKVWDKGESKNINGVDDSDGTITAYDDMFWNRHLDTYNIHSQNNPTANPPFISNVPGGNAFSVKAAKDGYLTLKLYIYSNKEFCLYDNSAEKYIENFSTDSEAIYNFTFQCKAGGDYYFWAKGSKIGLAGVTWSTGNLETKAGQTVTITTKPDSGYKASSIVTEPEQKVTQTGDNTFTFTMPPEPVNISAIFVDSGSTEHLVTAPNTEHGTVTLSKTYVATAEADETAELAAMRDIIDSTDNFLMADGTGGKWIVSSDGKVGETVVQDNSDINGNSTGKLKMTDKAVQYVLSDPITSGGYELSYDFYVEGSSGRSFRTYLDGEAHPYSDSTGQATAMGTDSAYFHMTDINNKVFVTSDAADLGAKDEKGTQVGSAAIENGKWYRVVISGTAGSSNPLTVSYYLHGTDGKYNPGGISSTPALTTNSAPITTGRTATLAQIKFMRTASGSLYYDNIKLTAENGTPEVNGYAIKAYAGEGIVVNATPDSGYEVASIEAVDADGNSIPVGEDNIFTMPASDVTVNVTFDVKVVPTPEPGSTLKTVSSSSDWIFTPANLKSYGTGDDSSASLTGTVIYDDLTIYIKPDATLSVDTTKDKEINGNTYTGRLKMGGSGSLDGENSHRVIAFIPGADGTVEVDYAHASGSGAARTLNIVHNGETITENVEADVSTFKTVDVKAGSPIYIYGTGGGLNFYAVHYTVK